MTPFQLPNRLMASFQLPNHLMTSSQLPNRLMASFQLPNCPTACRPADLADIEIQEKIGSGGFATVYRGTFRGRCGVCGGGGRGGAYPAPVRGGGHAQDTKSHTHTTAHFCAEPKPMHTPHELIPHTRIPLGWYPDTSVRTRTVHFVLCRAVARCYMHVQSRT